MSDPRMAGLATSPEAAGCHVVSSRRTLRAGIVRIACFFALLAALAFAVDATISTTLRGVSTGDLGVWNLIVQGKLNSDVIVSGSSRALTHYDSRILQERLGLSTYNIGLNGSQTDMQVARLQTYLRHNRAPRLLIHNLDAFSFQVTHGEVYDPGQYMPFRREPDLYKALTTVNPEAWRWRYIPLYGYATQDMRFGWAYGMRERLLGSRSETHFLGFKPRHEQWNEDFAQFRASNQKGFDIEIEDAGVRQIERLLEISKSHGIKVVFVYSPEYVEVQGLTRNRAEIFSLFRSVAAGHGAELIDFSDSAISADRDLFYNSQHLNAEGAARFTTELSEMLAPLAASLGPPTPAEQE